MWLTLVAEEDGQQLVNANRSGHFLRLSKITVTMNSHRFRSCLPAIVRGRNVRSKLHLAPDDDVVRNTAAKYICHHWHSLNIDHHLRRLNDTFAIELVSINVSTSTASLLLLSSYSLPCPWDVQHCVFLPNIRTSRLTDRVTRNRASSVFIPTRSPYDLVAAVSMLTSFIESHEIEWYREIDAACRADPP